MGLFDIGIRKEISNKDNFLNLLKDKITNDSKDSISLENNKLLLSNFSPKGVLLKFNLEAQIIPDGKKNLLVIDGELQQVLLIVIIILFSILFTYGIGVVLIVLFTYYQKYKASKYLENIINSLV